LYRSSGRFYDAVITVCDAIKAEVVKRGWFPADKILSIYNGVDLSKFGMMGDNGCLKREVGIDPMDPIVGFIGNIRRIKGLEYFIEAAPIVLKRNSNVQFLIIGEDFKRIGYARSDLELLAKKLGVSSRIHFIGKRNDVVELISIFDVGVVPSLSEGFSNVILEYMASSKAVVATNVGGNPEAVIHGETGFLVPPGDSIALAEAISSILKDREMRQRFGNAGRRRAENQFSMEGMLRSYEEVFGRTLRLKHNRESIKIIEN
jgi:glycosyltransferase involved in cell wall biosynthesis